MAGHRRPPDSTHSMPVTDEAGYQIGNMRWAESTDLVRVGDVLIPERIEVELPGAAGQPTVELTVEFRDGVPGFTRIELSSKSEARQIVSRDVGLVRDRMNHWLHNAILESAAQRPGGSVTAQDWASGAGPQTAIREVRPTTRRKVTDALLLDVAAIYRNNLDGKPVVAIQLAYNVPHRTAARYVQQARERGHLPATTRGRKTAANAAPDKPARRSATRNRGS